MPEATKIITALVTAGSNVPGLVPYLTSDFLTERIAISISGSGPAVKSLVSSNSADVYPGNVPSSGDLKFTRDLYPGEVIVMSVANAYYEIRMAANYDDGPSKTFSVQLWLEKNGQRVANPTAASLRVIKNGMNVVAFGTNNTHDSLGIFRFAETAVTLESRVIYNVDAHVETQTDLVDSNLAFVNL